MTRALAKPFFISFYGVKKTYLLASLRTRSSIAAMNKMNDPLDSAPFFRLATLQSTFPCKRRFLRGGEIGGCEKVLACREPLNASRLLLLLGPR